MKGVHVGARKADWGEFYRFHDKPFEQSYKPNEFTGWEALQVQSIADAMCNISGTSPMIVEGEPILREPWEDALWLLTDARDELTMTEWAYRKIKKAVFKSKGFSVLMQKVNEDESGDLRAELDRYGVFEESV
jgi:hypothetical protein